MFSAWNRAAACTFAIAVGLSAVSGCTTVHVQQTGDATVRTSHHAGLLTVVLDPGVSGLIVARSRGLGLGRSPTGSTLGWWQETWAGTGAQPGCQAVLWVERVEQVARIQSLLQQQGLALDRICLINEGASP
jgi:branched-subunit amino acid ABC-type transport system permease component